MKLETSIAPALRAAAAALTVAVPVAAIAGGNPALTLTVVCERYRWCSLPKAPFGDWYLGPPQPGGRDALDAWAVWPIDSGQVMMRPGSGARSVDVLLRQASGRTRLLRLIPLEPSVPAAAREETVVPRSREELPRPEQAASAAPPRADGAAADDR